MAMSGMKSIEQLFFRLAFLGGAVVLLFSILNGHEYLAVILRTAFSFILIYFLGQVLIKLWIKLTPKPAHPDKYRSTIDYLLGDDIEEAEKFEDKQDTPIAGQINLDMQNGLKDKDTKAELVRRMGLEEK